MPPFALLREATILLRLFVLCFREYACLLNDRMVYILTHYQEGSKVADIGRRLVR